MQCHFDAPLLSAPRSGHLRCGPLCTGEGLRHQARTSIVLGPLQRAPGAAVPVQRSRPEVVLGRPHLADRADDVPSRRHLERRDEPAARLPDPGHRAFASSATPGWKSSGYLATASGHTSMYISIARRPTAAACRTAAQTSRGALQGRLSHCLVAGRMARFAARTARPLRRRP